MIARAASATPEVPLAQERALQPAIRVVWVLSALIRAVVLAAGAALVEFGILVQRESWPLPHGLLTLGIAFLALASAAVFPRLTYRHWRYVVRPDAVLVSYGVIWRMRRCVPRLRIQHVDIDSGPIDRAFGLVRLSLYTAGTIAAVATIPGLAPAEAEALRELLLAAEPRRG